MNSAASG